MLMAADAMAECCALRRALTVCAEVPPVLHFLRPVVELELVHVSILVVLVNQLLLEP